MKPSRLKVAVICISLARGGAEKSTAILTKLLDALGHEVHVITITNQVEYEYAGKLFNLGADKHDNDGIIKRLLHLKTLRKYLKVNDIDVVIDNRTRNHFFKEFFYLHYIYCGFKIVYVVRSAFIENYFPKDKWLTRHMITRSTRVVTVSNVISKKINTQFNTKKAITIYNIVEQDKAVFNLNPENHIIFMGRIDNHAKDFSLLLDAYSKSALPEKQIELRIYGNGPDKSWLEKQVNTFGLSGLIKLFDFTLSAENVMKNAKYLVLSSNYEGFPRVLLEALSVGTPVISVDCESGPNEIIKNEFNGLLVENDNVEALANAFNRFIFEPDLYEYCKSNAQNSIRQFTQPIIAQQWKELLSLL
jgi:glycosyltransferase involved in cell wall biosynthesis